MYLNHLGVTSKPNSAIKRDVAGRVTQLMTKLLKYIDVDTAADELGRKFMYDSVPPVLNSDEEDHSVRGDGEYLEKGKVHNRYITHILLYIYRKFSYIICSIEFQPDTEIRLLRQFCLRVVLEGNDGRIYYNTENSRIYHGEDEQFLDIDLNLVPAVSYLMQSFPNYVSVEELPIDGDELKLQIASDLWERGLLVTKTPLQCIDDD